MDFSNRARASLDQLLQFLEQDPGNQKLLADAVARALDADDATMARDLIARHGAQPLPATLQNLAGLAAVEAGEFSEAAVIFETLRARGENDPALRFNLAWARAMTGAYQEALELLDDETLAASMRAPSLKLQMMHHLGLVDEALEAGASLAARFPEDRMLMAALATLALDAEQPEMAREYAQRAGDSAEAQAALGMLALGDQDVGASQALFDRALNRDPANPRALLGKGLGMLVTGDVGAAMDAIDKGAELFGSHIGSWIASGWGHFIGGDYARARESFDRALSLDDNFAESHGALAVLDVIDGRIDDAKRRCEIALRLDSGCMGAILAKSLLLERSGHAQMAQKIRENAMTMPVSPGGLTLGQAMVRYGAGAATRPETRQ